MKGAVSIKERIYHIICLFLFTGGRNIVKRTDLISRLTDERRIVCIHMGLQKINLMICHMCCNKYSALLAVVKINDVQHDWSRESILDSHGVYREWCISVAISFLILSNRILVFRAIKGFMDFATLMFQSLSWLRKPNETFVKDIHDDINI